MKLSICSVCSDDVKGENSRTLYAEYLNENLRMTRDEKMDFEWIVLSGKNPYQRPTHRPFRKVDLDPFFNKHEIDHKYSIQGQRLVKGSSSDNYMKGHVGKVSVVHSAELNYAVKHIDPESKYVLLLDTDFYIVPPLHAVINFMEEKGLAFFGASYSCAKLPTIRDFPVVFCMFINTEIVDVQSLDFTSGYGADSVRPDIYPDSGYKVYTKYKGSDVPYDIAYPTVLPDNPFLTRHPKFKYTRDTVLGKKKIDEYWFDDKIFAFHTRAKMNSGKMTIEAKVDKMSRQIDLVKKTMGSVRKSGLYSFREYENDPR